MVEVDLHSLAKRDEVENIRVSWSQEHIHDDHVHISRDSYAGTLPPTRNRSVPKGVDTTAGVVDHCEIARTARKVYC